MSVGDIVDSLSLALVPTLARSASLHSTSVVFLFHPTLRLDLLKCSYVLLLFFRRQGGY